MTVAAILRHKGHEVVSVEMDATIAELVQILVARRIGAVAVLDSDGRLCGILSERDVMRSLAQHGAAALERRASQLMTADLTTGTPGTTVAQAMAMMTDGRFRHLPVVENGALIGMVSIGDVVKARMTQQETEVDSLKAYVVSTV